MTTAATTDSALKIDPSKVAHVYSGRPGCCCGCRGKHTYAAAHVEWASKNRGYDVTPDEVNDRVVKMLTGRVMRLAAESLTDTAIELDICDEYIAVETETRLTIVYLVASAE